MKGQDIIFTDYTQILIQPSFKYVTFMIRESVLLTDNQSPLGETSQKYPHFIYNVIVLKQTEFLAKARLFWASNHASVLRAVPFRSVSIALPSVRAQESCQILSCSKTQSNYFHNFGSYSFHIFFIIFFWHLSLFYCSDQMSLS